MPQFLNPSIRRGVWVLVGLVALLATFAAGWIAGRTGIVARAVDPATLSVQEREFTERMKNVSLVGRFTIAGRDDRGGAPDRYDISSVEKVGDGLWRFTVRMGDSNNVAIPITVPLQWVGDTPTIVMKDYAIPGLGTFGARVFFAGDRYAGTWDNPKVGGLMYGRIEKLKIED